MSEPVQTPPVSEPPVQIDYFNAKVEEALNRSAVAWWQDGNQRAALLVAVAVLVTWLSVALPSMSFDFRNVAALLVWCLGMWYVAERITISRTKSPYRVLFVVFGILAAGLAPLALYPEGLIGVWNRGWRAAHLPDLQLISLVLLLVTLLLFTIVEISDLIRRRRTLLAGPAVAAQSLRSDS